MSARSAVALIDRAPALDAPDVSTIIETNPLACLVDSATYAAWRKHIGAELAAAVPDVTTDKGRKAISALAYRVTRSKTAIDLAGKKLNEDARASINKVDARRREVWAELEDLAATVRKSLTDWEDAEQARLDRMRDALATLTALGDRTDDLPAMIARLQSFVIDETFAEFQTEAERSRTVALIRVRAAKAAADQREADRLELERLRVIQAERDAADRAAEQERQAAAIAAHQAAIDAEADRLAGVAAAEREAAAVEAAVAAARALADAAVAEAQAVVDAAAAAEEARLADVARLESEQKERDRDVAHRAATKTAAKLALIKAGATEPVAIKIVLAILAGKIPNVRLVF